MNRRDALTLLGGAAAAWPVVARGQRAMPVVGFLSPSSKEAVGHFAEALRRGLAEGGFKPDELTVEERWAEGRMGQLRKLADELAGAQVSVIVAAGDPAALAAKQATASVPIVFTSGDPLKRGLVESYNKPGGNITGIAIRITDLGGKRLGLIREVIPAGSQVAALFDPSQPTFNSELQEIQDASKILGLQLQVLRAGTPEQIDAAFARMKELRVAGLIVSPSLFYSTQRVRLTNTAIAQRLPTIFGQKEYAALGGLMSYGANPADAYFEAGVYAAKILKGARPADLPVLQSAKFQLVINQKTAKTLGLTFPSGIISIADEVIE